MEQFIGCDAHKKLSLFVAVNEKGRAGETPRLAHDRQLHRGFLPRLPPRSAISVDAGHYSWVVDQMERVDHCPKLCNQLEATWRMVLTKKRQVGCQRADHSASKRHAGDMRRCSRMSATDDEE